MAKDGNISSHPSVTYEDQKKINMFARKNARCDELEDEIMQKKKELQNLEDAADDLMLLDEDESGPVPFLIGEVFINHSMEETEELIEKAKNKLKSEIEGLEKSCADIKSIMDDLKVKLKAKFGDQINLERDEEEE